MLRRTLIRIVKAILPGHRRNPKERQANEDVHPLDERIAQIRRDMENNSKRQLSVFRVRPGEPIDKELLDAFREEGKAQCVELKRLEIERGSRQS